MPGTTSTWTGAVSNVGTLAANWTPSGGPPGSGATEIINLGTLDFTDYQFSANTLKLNGGTLQVFNDSTLPAASGFNASTTLIAGAAGTTEFNAFGGFVNQGTILADGPAGSTFTIDIGTTVASGTTVPGYFYNNNLIQADAGNTLTIAIGASSELFNAGSIVADGGKVLITAAPSAISGGIVAVDAFYVIEAGGTLETQASYPPINGNLPGGSSPRYEFADTTPGNTLKIDDLSSFGGAVVGFQAGDTVDLGTSLAVGALVYTANTGLLELENATGTILDSLFLSTNGMTTSGTFAVSNGTADSIIIGTGADGDTVLTTDRTFPEASGVSGTWQSSASWNHGTIPGGPDTAVIGLGEATKFTLTTGAAPVSVASISIFDPQASLQITSDTTAIPGIANVYTGTLEVTGGNTLTTSSLRTFDPLASVLVAAHGTVDVTGRPGTTLAAVGGTLAIEAGNSSAVQISAGSLVVDGALLAGPAAAEGGGSFTIGYDSARQPASVTVNSGGTVTDTHSLLGSDPTSFGELTLNGPGASWTDEIDVTDTAHATGYINVGYNDLSSNTPAGLAAPGPAAAAQLLIENGATLTDQAYSQIGDSIDSAGNVTVTTGGFWNLASNGVGYMDVGQVGSGTLSVLNGGSVALGASGTFFNNGTTFTGGGIGVAQSAGSSGTVIISGAGSQLSTLNGIAVGKGGQGVLSILNGGTVLVNAGGVSVGTTTDEGSSGTVTVGGPRAAAALDFAAASATIAAAGGLTVGSVSQGTLIVSDNGAVNVDGTGYLTIGGDAGATGSVVVGGTTSAAVINIGTEGLTVGYLGTGYLTVNNLGTVALTGTGGVGEGETAGAMGAITVDGGLLTEGASTNGMGLGGASGASGSMLIENSGTVSLMGNWLTAGGAGGSSGTVTVTGSGSDLKTSGTAGITIGYSGAGTLSVTNGGSLSVTGTGGISVGGNSGGSGQMAISGGTVADGNYLTIGGASAGSGTVTVTGSSSKLTVANLLEVGQSGSGTLIVTGATVSAGNLGLGGSTGTPSSNSRNIAALTDSADIAVATNLAVWQGSTLSLDGSSGIDVGGASPYLGGTIDVASNHTLIGNGLIVAAVLNSGVIDASSATSGPINFNGLEIKDAITGSGVLQIGIDATLRLDAGMSSGQSVQFGSGSELILNNTAPGTITNSISGLNIGDKIEFGSPVTSISSGLISSPGTITVQTNLGTYVFNSVTFAAGASQALNPYFDSVSGDWAIQVVPQNVTWIGGSGALGIGANWNPPGNGDPTSSETINFNNKIGGALTGSANGLNANFSGTSTWTLQGATLTLAGYPNAPYQPFALSDNGTLVVNGGSLIAGGSSDIDATQGASMVAQGGAQLAFEGTALGNSPGNEGSLLVTGIGTTWENVPGNAPSGDGGYLLVGFAGEATGGLGGGVGHVTITAGASMINTSGDTVGAQAGSEGDIAVTAGGSLTDNGLTIGQGGTGTLAVSDGIVNAMGYVGIGQNIGAEGVVSLTNGTITASNGVQIGASGAGTMTINAGGTVLAGGTGTGVGLYAGSDGDLIINAGGVWEETLPSQYNASVFNIGEFAGTGTLAAASGDVLVTGAGAVLNTNGNPLTISEQGGSGTLTVADGGTVITGTSNVNLGDPALFSRRGDATLIVEGAGSRLIADGFSYLGRSGSANLTIENGGSVLIGVDPTGTGGLSIGAGAGSSNNGQGGNGELTATTDGVLTDDQNLNIGGNGVNGEAYINSGGTIQIGTSLVIGIATELSGTIYGGSGALSIGAGGTVELTGAPSTTNYEVAIGTANSSVGEPTDLATGEVTVSGPGALLDTNGSGLSVGEYSNGMLTVGQGGTVEAGTPNSTDVAALSVGRQGDGNVVVDGGSLLANGDIYIGRAGTGDLLVENNGSVHVGLDGTSSTSDASLNIGGAGAASGSIYYVGGAGSMQVTTDGMVTSLLDVEVGRDGTSGDLSINGGGVVETAQQVLVGTSATVAAGDTIISASGSATVVTAPTLEIGNGSVDIGAGGTLASAQGFDVGTGAGASGAVTVTGNRSLLSDTGKFVVGDAGVGSLSILADGTVITNPGASSPAAIIANTTAASGSSVTVTGAGSDWGITGTLDVGNVASGTLDIGSGATVTATSLVAAAQTGGNGVITVTGTGSALTLTGSLTVGNQGTGELSIFSGATVSALDVTIGNASGLVSIAAGSELLIGAGSELTVNGTLANFGAINGGRATEVAFGSGTDRLILGPLATFGGTVMGGGIHTTLELAAGSTAGALTGLGTSFTNFGTVIVDPGATWTVDAAISLLAMTTFIGGGALSTLALTNAGTFSLAGASNFGTIDLAAGNNTVTVTDKTLSGGAATIHDGASGNNSISAAGATSASKGKALTYYTGTGADSFAGGFENDGVHVSAAAVGGDTLTGGSGTNTLTLTSAGTANLGGVSKFGTINLAAGNSTVTVADKTLSGGSVIINDGASGNNSISAAGDTSASKGKALSYYTGTGTDSFTGGFESDAVRVSATAVGGDTLTGGSGTNTLTLTSAGTANLGGVSKFGTINLAAGNNTVAVTDKTLSGGSVTINDGASGNNTISAAGDTSASKGKGLTYNAGTGTDRFAGGFESDAVRVSASAVGGDTLTGGSGTNTLTLTSAGTANLGGVSKFGTINLAAGNNTVAVTDKTLSGGSVTINDGASGNNTISAAGDTSASTGKSLTYHAGSGTNGFTGGFENDTIYAGTGSGTYTAGSGSDSFVFIKSSLPSQTLHNFQVSTDDILVYGTHSAGGFDLGSTDNALNPTTPTAIDVSIFVTNASGDFTSSRQRFAYDTTNGSLFYSATGSNTSQSLVAHLTGEPAFTASNLLFEH